MHRRSYPRGRQHQHHHGFGECAYSGRVGRGPQRFRREPSAGNGPKFFNADATLLRILSAKPRRGKTVARRRPSQEQTLVVSGILDRVGSLYSVSTLSLLVHPWARADRIDDFRFLPHWTDLA